MNGNSSLSNSNSLRPDGDGRDLPLWFRLAMAIPPMLVSGL